MGKTNFIPPINSLAYFSKKKNRCPYCEESKTEFYNLGRNQEESDRFIREGKVKPLWVCSLKPNIAIGEGIRTDVSGNRCCTYDEWLLCPLH